MRRRDFILTAGAAALWSGPAQAQRTAPVVGVLAVAPLEAA
ncbi:hypothetical protein [Bradyrhizobium liaoningense]|nr:hypothetical protein [Bradyrhizobium liaoningense]